jgi:hypothetical protein
MPWLLAVAMAGSWLAVAWSRARARAPDASSSLLSVSMVKY